MHCTCVFEATSPEWWELPMISADQSPMKWRGHCYQSIWTESRYLTNVSESWLGSCWRTLARSYDIYLPIYRLSTSNPIPPYIFIRRILCSFQKLCSIARNTRHMYISHIHPKQSASLASIPKQSSRFIIEIHHTSKVKESSAVGLSRVWGPLALA